MSVDEKKKSRNYLDNVMFRSEGVADPLRAKHSIVKPLKLSPIEAIEEIEKWT